MKRFAKGTLVAVLAAQFATTAPLLAETPPARPSLPAAPSVVAVPSPAASVGATRAGELKEQGDRARDAQRYDDAVRAYEASYALVPDPAILYEEARIYKATEQFPKALDAISRFQVEAPRELQQRVSGLGALATDLRRHVGTLVLRCEAPGAEVTLRGRVMGKTPIDAPLRLNAGPAVITVALAGFVPFHKEVDLRGGDTTWVEVSLEPVDRKGVLSVKVPGNAAVLSVDGKPVGMTPIDVSLTPGIHALVLHREGSYDFRATATVAAGQKKDVAYSLSGPRSFSPPWWVWTSIAVVAIGVSIATYAAFAEKNHTFGDHFTPGVASEPLTRW